MPAAETDRATVDIRGFLPNSLSEWEGRVSAVIFTAGCNWRCAYCHGWRFVQNPDQLPSIPEEEVFAGLKRQADWLDGVTITGGEPTLQPSLPDLLRRLKEMELPVKLETNGTRPEVLEKLLAEELIECLCLDYKAPLDERLVRLVAVDIPQARVKAVRQSFALATASGLEREYHTTLCPAFIDAPTLGEMAEALEPGGLWILQQYEIEEVLDAAAAGRQRFTVDELEELRRIAAEKHERVLLKPGKGG